MSKEEALQMLDALKDNETKIRERMNHRIKNLDLIVAISKIGEFSIKLFFICNIASKTTAYNYILTFQNYTKIAKQSKSTLTENEKNEGINLCALGPIKIR